MNYWSISGQTGMIKEFNFDLWTEPVEDFYKLFQFFRFRKIVEIDDLVTGKTEKKRFVSFGFRGNLYWSIDKFFNDRFISIQSKAEVIVRTNDFAFCGKGFNIFIPSKESYTVSTSPDEFGFDVPMAGSIINFQYHEIDVQYQGGSFWAGYDSKNDKWYELIISLSKGDEEYYI